MAGPLPGLLIGIILSISNQNNVYPDWVNTLSWMLIGLNLFNLLPVYPLDGGQIAELLIFSRFTYAKVIFQVIGALLLGLFALANPGILVLTIAVLASIPLTLRTASFNKQLRKHFRNNPPANREAMLRSIFVQMKQLGHDNLPFHQKYTLAKQFIERRQEWNANSSTKLLLILLYFGSLFGGIIGTLQAVIPDLGNFALTYLETPQQRQKRYMQRTQQQIVRAYDAIKTNPNDIENRLLRASLHLRSRNYHAAIQDYDYLLRLHPQDTFVHNQKALTLQMLKDYKGAIGGHCPPYVL